MLTPVFGNLKIRRILGLLCLFLIPIFSTLKTSLIKTLIWMFRPAIISDCIFSFFKILPYVKNNRNISLFSLRRISFTFKDKIQKTKRSFFFCLYFNILDTNFIRKEKQILRRISKINTNERNSISYNPN